LFWCAAVIVGVVLAAGLARRMGRGKLLLELDGAPVIRRTVEGVLAAGLDRVLVVVGPEHAAMREALSGLPVELAVNPEPEAGQGRSIRAGIEALPPGATAALVAMGDQPTVPAPVIPALRSALASSGKAIAAPVYREGRGNPVLFGAAVFPELRRLEGDRGARSIVELDPGRVALVELDLPMPPDVDTPDDYDRLRQARDPV
jgi:molybdenum cofactor cytidylyltransferase